MKDLKHCLKLGISILSVLIIIWSCSDEETIGENSSPQISSITSSSDVVGFGNTISLSVEGVDNDGDRLTYSWSSDGGEFSNNSKGQSLTWTAPRNFKTFTLDLAVSDGKVDVEENILVDVIPAYNDFIDNSILNFSINTPHCELEITEGVAIIKPITVGYVAAISSPEFTPRLSLPYSIESTLGLFQDLEDSNDYYYLSMKPTYSSSDDKVLTEVAVYLNPNGSTSNWRLVAKTLIKSNTERKSTSLISGMSSSLKSVGELNKISLSFEEDKGIVLTLNDNVLYKGFVLKEFIENQEYNTNWEVVKGIVGVSSGDNSLTINKIAIE